ncbi:hypothetical protein EV128_12261 [Rhizobium azibense]|nr:hypothetical protein EV128_12261 [Rhizobium azibense]
MNSVSTITLTITCTESERAALIERFIQTANAVTGEIEDDGTPGDPNGDKRDATGVVWDARFHGANMSKNQDGTWRRKKGLSEQEKADADAYETGCRGASQVAQVAAGIAPVATTAPVAAAPVTAPAADVPAFLQTGSFAPTPAAPVMVMPGMPALAPTAPPPPPPAPTYDELIATFQAVIGRVGQPVVDANLAAIYQTAGVTDVNQLLEDPEKRRSVKNSLDALTA